MILIRDSVKPHPNQSLITTRPENGFLFENQMHETKYRPIENGIGKY